MLVCYSDNSAETVVTFLSYYESNFVSTGAIARSRAYFGQGTGAIVLDQVACTGTELRLVNCSSNPIGVHDCSHFEDAGVTCQSMLPGYFIFVQLISVESVFVVLVSHVLTFDK